MEIPRVKGTNEHIVAKVNPSLSLNQKEHLNKNQAMAEDTPQQPHSSTPPTMRGPYRQWASAPSTRSQCEPLAANSPPTDPSYQPDYSTVYFGYGSNLSPRTMKQRCPDSLFIGLGKLDDYRWHINSSQYANVIPSKGDVVWGGLYFLSKRDEAMLDQSEGVPWSYEKHRVKCQRVPEEGEVDALCYVDVQRTVDDKIEPDYIFWINKGIKEASQFGLPTEYVEKYLRPFTPLPPPPEKEQDILYIRIVCYIP